MGNRFVAVLIVVASSRVTIGCSSPEVVRVLDLHADFRDIWQGREQPETGKETSPDAKVRVQFNVPLKSDLAVGEYIPVSADAVCKRTVPAVRDESDSANQAPTILSLMASQPLVGGCRYRFSIPTTAPVSSRGAHLAAPLTVTFRVAKGHASPAARELINVSRDVPTHTLTLFTVRPGINAPVDEALIRYQDEIGIPASDLRPSGEWTGSFVSRTELEKRYLQYAHGYEVFGAGYMVQAEGGMFRSAVGKVFPGIPAPAPPRLTSPMALQKAIEYLGLTPPPWVNNPADAPAGRLLILQQSPDTKPTDFALVWSFALGRKAGIPLYSGIDVDAHSGEILRANKVLQFVQ